MIERALLSTNLTLFSLTCRLSISLAQEPHDPEVGSSNPSRGGAMYLLDILKLFEQKEHFS